MRTTQASVSAGGSRDMFFLTQSVASLLMLPSIWRKENKRANLQKISTRYRMSYSMGKGKMGAKVWRKGTSKLFQYPEMEWGRAQLEQKWGICLVGGWLKIWGLVGKCWALTAVTREQSNLRGGSQKIRALACLTALCNLVTTLTFSSLCWEDKDVITLLVVLKKMNHDQH